MKLFPKNLHQPDYRFIVTLGAIIVFGLAMLSSASAPEAYQKFGDTYYFLKHQIFYGLLPGLLVLVALAFINYQILKRFAFYMLLASIVLLLIVFIPGIGSEFGTAKSWIIIGNFTMQPAELVKLTFLIYLATWLENRGEKKTSDFTEGLIPFITVLGVVGLLMMLQPDFGTLSIIACMALIVYFVGGGSIKHIIGIIGLGLILVYILMINSTYRAARLTTFLHPEMDPQGIGYHINQAFLAIGSGGFWGRGFGLSRQKFQYLPEVIGDSIYAVIAEELGFIFAAALICGFVYLMYRGFKIAQNAPDTFGKLLAVGIIAWFTIQTFVNIGAMVGLMPLTGVPLPFISQGGSALVVAMGASGILINISRQTKEY